MYRKVVVPLDGSKVSECVLPHIQYLAKQGGAEVVILVRVADRPASFEPLGPSLPPAVFVPGGDGLSQMPLLPARREAELPVRVSRAQLKAEKYLERFAKRLNKGRQRVEVKTKVLLGDPAEQIVNFAHGEGADLVVIASHGRSGIGRWAMGSVADRVFRSTKVPVLMVKCGTSPVPD